MNTVNIYSNYIKGYFLLIDNCDYIFNITEFDNIELTEQNNVSFIVRIDFLPEEYTKYNFDVVETTMSTLNVKYDGYHYIINLLSDNINAPIAPIAPIALEKCFEDDEEYEEYLRVKEDIYYDEDGYDSEGYYFRVK